MLGLLASINELDQPLKTTAFRFLSFLFPPLSFLPLQEGVGAEAAAFSAHEQLDNLIIMYDSNDVTLDKMAEFTMSEDTGKRYESYGWDVVTIDGHDLDAVSKVRIASTPPAPSLLCLDIDIH